MRAGKLRSCYLSPDRALKHTIVTSSSLTTLDGYHLYMYPTHSPYSINLIRNDIHNKRLEQHRLKVRYAPFFCPSGLTSPFNTTPCPLPLYYFPSPYPFSSYPTVSSHLPQHGRSLKVRIPDPWAQCLQLFESDSIPHSYTAISTHLNRNGKVNHDVVAPSDSTFNLAKDAFKMFFKLRTGVEWESAPRAADIKREDSAARERTLSHDGAGDWTYQLEYEVEACQKGARKPSVTMVVSEEDAGEKWDVRAKTPDGGW